MGQMETCMKTLIIALALSAAAIVPLTAHAGPRAQAQAGSRKVVHVSGRHFVARPHVYWQGQDLGTDPDRNIRYQMWRDADLAASNH
jgi:hypothetical protein